MNVLMSLTYFRPHVSGLTLYVERLARGLTSRGHAVTVLTSRHDPAVPEHELLDGVRVIRAPVTLRISKGVVMRSYGRLAGRLLEEADVVNPHLPQLEALTLATRARLAGARVVATHHCDLQLPPGALNRLADRAISVVDFVTAACADRVVTYSQDYADHSALLRRFESKVAVVLPPVVIQEPAAADVDAFKAEHGIATPTGSRPTLGLAARFTAEKGIDTVLQTLPILAERFPDLRVLFAGPYLNIVGEEEYWRRLRPEIEAQDDAWKFLGVLDPAREMPLFFSAIDCLLVPSVNSTESFGIVQVEAMLLGTPVVASDLPGVREPVRLTGMGELVPPSKPRALAAAITRVLGDRESYRRPRTPIRELFDAESSISRYEELLLESARSRRRRSRPRS